MHSHRVTTCIQWRKPHRVFDVGLATRHVLDVLRIDQHDGPTLFQDVEHRPPIHACAFEAISLRSRVVSQSLSASKLAVIVLKVRSPRWYATLAMPHRGS